MKKHIIDHWVEREMYGEEIRTILVVETDLETRPDAKGFDSSAFDDFTNYLVINLKKSSIDTIKVIPSREQKGR